MSNPGSDSQLYFTICSHSLINKVDVKHHLMAFHITAVKPHHEVQRNSAEELVLCNSNSCSYTVSEHLFQHPYDAITVPWVIRVSLLHPVPLNTAGSKHE